MIYEIPRETDPIRQGDIFYPLPYSILNIDKLKILTKDGKITLNSWQNISKTKEMVIQVPIVQKFGIVASQNCDAEHAPLISLFEIDTFVNVTGLSSPESPKRWVNAITKQSRLNARWFYLPIDENIGFKERMAVNFHIIFQVQRESLEKSKSELRIARLNEISYQHYRECIAHYFRRYPYDEWYPLVKEEFEAYNLEKGPVEPFDWQKE